MSMVMSNCYQVVLSPCIAPPAQEGFLVILQKEKEAKEAGAMHWTP